MHCCLLLHTQSRTAMEDVPGADSAVRAYHNGSFDMMRFTRGHRSWEKPRGKAEIESLK